jgi:hypothetical protein
VYQKYDFLNFNYFILFKLFSFSPLNLMSSEESLLTSDGQALQPRPGLENLSLLVVDGFGFRMTVSNQTFRGLGDLADSVLLRGHVLLELVELPLEDLDVLEVMAELLRRDEGLLVVDPEQNLIALTKELNQNLVKEIKTKLK